ncbi:MAG TPA: hypothetical protein VHO68_00715 [Bacteroidales bacterium]|nr:hypothetical protein [Bacteroidales bacterium]
MEIAKGEILFPGEKVIQPVKISGLKLNFPDGTPEEISFFKRKVLTGKIYNGRTNEVSPKSDTIYVIVDSYNPESKGLRFTHISDNFNQNGKPFRINMEGEYAGLGMSTTVQSDTKNPWSGSLWIQKSKSEFKMRLIYPNGNGVDFVPVAEIPISAPTPKTEARKTIVENGVIVFPENDTPQVILKELKFSFPSDSPTEVLALKGKVYGSTSTKTGQTTYLVPIGFDPKSKVIRLFYVTNNSAQQTPKPVKMTIEGVYKGADGSELKPIHDKSDKPWVKFFIVSIDGVSKPRLLWPNGADYPFFVVAELPA